MSFLENTNFDWMEMLNFYERPFRATFVPSKVWLDLDKYVNDEEGLANYFKKWRTKIKWVKEKSKAIKYNRYIAIGGEYDAETRQCIIIIYTDKFRTYKFDKENWDRFKFKLIQVEMHELIHFMQYDRRGDESSRYVLPYKKVKHTKKDAERRYLSEFDEIQAYAHCVLLDFKDKRPTIPTQSLISRARTYRDSKTLHYILRTFNYDFRNNHAIPKLMQQIMKWDRKYQRFIRASRRPK
jgi:hypothetical protein